MQANEKGVLKSSDIYFHIPSNITKELFFYILCVGEFHCAEDYHVKRNNYDSILMMYVKEGRGNICYEGKNYTAKENDLVILDCHNSHEYYTHQSWKTEWIHIDGNISSNFFDLIYNKLGCVIPLNQSSIIPTYLREILHSYRNNKELPEPLVSSYIHSMLSELLLITSEETQVVSKYISPIKEAVMYIEDNFSQKLTLKSIASKVNMSVFHFSREFKKEIGYAPYEYIIKTRIGKSKVYLKNTNLSIKEIAFSTGFSSESSFVYTFHKNIGITPTKFRNLPF